MSARFYTLLFVLFPYRYQCRLRNYLANKHGYHGFTKFGDATMWVQGTKMSEDDFYKSMSETLKEKTLES